MARKRKSGSEASKQFSGFMKRNRVAAAVIVIFVLAVAAAVLWFNNFLSSAPCFEVKKVEIVKPGSEGNLYIQEEYFNLEYPVNFFTVDTAALAGKIKAAHPEFQIVVITKFLPNRIIANIKDREAVARIRFGKVLPVDFDCVIVSDTGSLDSLPLITGLESRLADPKEGTRVKSRRLNTALDILRRIYSRKEFARSAVTTVDMTYPEKAFFVMGGMTIVVGNNDLDRKLDSLAAALNNPKVDRSKIDSIDLRFTDAAVTFKPEKK
ncbi:MAG: hypothetical protein PHX64_01615 [Candidatus Omnitrophica bacterium]|nr:hypothetical protein [Candidatus Omnitrophota bacterium]MDD5310437.1 hypothetical protein [Candidatus Omnitrophota bacterium]MDD5546719.1 hypothetical protein [Candidatus Omnitrophota bacterium]